MKTLKNYRHGEIAFIGVDSLPEGLEKSESRTIMTGSHGHDHSIDKGELYFKKEDDFTFGYLVAKDTNLLHPEHSPKIGDAKLEDGIYKLVKQNEFTPEGLIPVID